MRPSNVPLSTSKTATALLSASATSRRPPSELSATALGVLAWGGRAGRGVVQPAGHLPPARIDDRHAVAAGERDVETRSLHRQRRGMTADFHAPDVGESAVGENLELRDRAAAP